MSSSLYSTSDPKAQLPEDLWCELSSFLTRERRQRMEGVVAGRTYQIRVALQDVHGEHNISACLRSAEALGIQQVDILSLREEERQKSFRPTSVACGIAHWLSIQEFKSAQQYQTMLADKGYELYVAMPTTKTRSSESLAHLAQRIFSQKKPLAVLFGNERDGVHRDLQKITTGSFTIPTSGFVESMNVSVATAITLHHLTLAAQKLLQDSYFLRPEQQRDLLNFWISKHFAHWPTLYKKSKASPKKSDEEISPK